MEKHKIHENNEKIVEKHKIHENNAKFMKLSQSSGGRHRTTRQNRIAHISNIFKLIG